MSEPGTIEIDRSGDEPVVRIVQPDDSFTVSQLRMYAEYLATVANEAAAPPPEPEVEALVLAFKGTEARYLTYEEALPVLARAVLAAGYKRENAAAEGASWGRWPSAPHASREGSPGEPDQ